MKKYHLISILLLSFVLLGAIQPVYSETEARLEELSSQQARIEQMKTVINSLFVLAKGSDRREIVESALNQLLNKIDTVQERAKKKMEELERERDLKIIRTADDPKELVDAFSRNATLENFELVCNRAKKIKVKQTKEVLSKDRTEMVIENKSLYEIWNDCQEFLENEKTDRFIYTKPKENHKVKLLSSDTDNIREYKIKHNQKIQEIIDNYYFYRFDKRSLFGVDPISSDNPADHLDILFNIEKYTSEERINIWDYKNINILFPCLGIITPKEIIRNVLVEIEESKLEKNLRELAENLKQMEERIR